jgi:hemoglobin
MTDSTQATQDESLYAQLGGEPAVNAAVDIFYRKVIADSRINTFFLGSTRPSRPRSRRPF